MPLPGESGTPAGWRIPSTKGVLSLKVLTVITFACGLALIAFGFASLSRGSLTLAPVLLIGGYCVAIPVAIMIGRPGGRQTGSGGDERANSSAG